MVLLHPTLVYLVRLPMQFMVYMLGEAGAVSTFAFHPRDFDMCRVSMSKPVRRIGVSDSGSACSLTCNQVCWVLASAFTLITMGARQRAVPLVILIAMIVRQSIAGYCFGTSLVKAGPAVTQASHDLTSVR